MTRKNVRIAQWKVVVAMLALSLLIAVPVLASDTVTLTVNGEGRSASVDEASLESVDYSHEDQSTAGTISLVVDDSSASHDGWNVRVAAGDFMDGDVIIPASNFSITNANAPAHMAGNEIDEIGGPKVPDGGASGSLDSPRKVLYAEAGYGAGTYGQVLDVELLVPGQTPAGAYVSNLTVDITAGP